MSTTGHEEIAKVKLNDPFTEVHLVMTTYRADPSRHELFCRSLRSLAEHTRVRSRLWLMDEGCGPDLPDVRGVLADSAVELGAVCVAGDRIGQAGEFNRGLALVEDDVRQRRQVHRTFLVKLEDDFEFTEEWLRTLMSVWYSPEFPDYNIALLGGANGEPGRDVRIAGQRVRLTFHVAAGCMFAPLAIWRTLDVPVPNRGRRDEQGGETPSSAVVDWYVTNRAMASVRMLGRRCGLLEGLIKHRGGGHSTWRPRDREDGDDG